MELTTGTDADLRNGSVGGILAGNVPRLASWSPKPTVEGSIPSPAAVCVV